MLSTCQCNNTYKNFKAKDKKSRKMEIINYNTKLFHLKWGQ